MTLIDVDEINFERDQFETYNDYSFAFDTIDNASTIEAVPLSVLEDIKAEIQYVADNDADVSCMKAYYHCLNIIDKHIISKIPSVQPKMGHWIDHTDYDYPISGSTQECSECGKRTHIFDAKYCPNCKVKMHISAE